MEPVLSRLEREYATRQTSDEMEQTGPGTSVLVNNVQNTDLNTLQNNIISAIMVAQKEQFAEFEKNIRGEINTANRPIDGLISDLIPIPCTENSEPPAKRAKLVNDTSDKGEASSAQNNEVTHATNKGEASCALTDVENTGNQGEAQRAQVSDTENRGEASKSAPSVNAEVTTPSKSGGKPQESETNLPLALSRLSDKLASAENAGPPISEGLAKIINTIVRDRLSRKEDATKKRMSIMENNLRPENCETMAAPRVNKEIWGSMSAQTRGNDIEYQKTQNALLKALGPIASVMDEMIKTDPEGKDAKMSKMIDKLMESVSLMAYANDDLNDFRRKNIKADLSNDFKSLCSNQVPITEFLFGDNISDQVKSIQDGNKVGKQISSNNFLGSKPSWTRGSGKGKGGWGKGPQHKQHPRQPYNKPQSGYRHYNKKRQ